MNDAFQPQPPPPPPSPSWPAPTPPPTPEFAAPAPTPHDPVWRGVDVAIIVIFTAFATAIAMAAGAIILALLVRPSHGEVYPFLSVRFMLATQTAGLAAGVLFAWLWLRAQYDAPFWRSLHYRRISENTVAGVIAGGVFVSIALQLLGHLLPMPKDLPIEKLIQPRTAWLMALYGVLAAPFFEEFFFRGLLFPSLQHGFAEGMTAEEARQWRPVLWVLGTFVGLLSGYQWLVRFEMGTPTCKLAVLCFLAFAVVILADPLMRLVSLALNRLARWRPSSFNAAEWLAIAVTGLLFGLVHSQQLAGSLFPLLLVTIVGIVLTALRARTGSVVASWLFHAAYNGTLFTLLYLGSHGFHHFPTH